MPNLKAESRKPRNTAGLLTSTCGRTIHTFCNCVQLLSKEDINLCISLGIHGTSIVNEHSVTDGADITQPSPCEKGN